MGAVVASSRIYDAFMTATETGIEFFHGYTYSGHPLAIAAGLAAQEIYRSEGVYENATSLASYFEQAVHSLRGAPFVTDIRNIGLAAGISIETRNGAAGARAMDAFAKTFELGALIRVNGDILALAPIPTMGQPEIDRIVDTVGRALREID